MTITSPKDPRFASAVRGFSRAPARAAVLPGHGYHHDDSRDAMRELSLSGRRVQAFGGAL